MFSYEKIYCQKVFVPKETVSFRFGILYEYLWYSYWVTYLVLLMKLSGEGLHSSSADG